MAEPDKQQLGDGHDNYAHAAQQAAKAAKQATKAATAKGAAVAAKGAEATTKAAAAVVASGAKTGSAVAEVASGTAAGGPWGAIIAAAWAMRKTLFKVLICICLVLVIFIVIIVSLPSLIWDYLFGTDDSPPAQRSITDIYNEMAGAVSDVVNEGL
ncbi:MAG: peptidoglycan endopeptidase, partial [Oscillospiraceae bacterium]|nr:peptidoglycan endopeptidase [Oscillospiraceae bacterium]